MKLAILTPFTPTVLTKWIPALAGSGVPKGMGGTANFDLVTGLLERGHEVHVVTLQPGLAQSLSYVGRKASVHVIPRRLKGAHRTLWNLERTMMLEAIKQVEPEVVHAHWTYEYGLTAINYSPAKSLITAHDLPLDLMRYDFNPYYLPSFFATHYVYRRAHWLSGVSPAVTAYVRRFARKSANIDVIPNIAPPTHTRTNPNMSDLPQPFIITLGSWNKNKNISTALKAFRLFRELGYQEYHYLLLGGGLGGGEGAQAWAIQHGFADNVHFLGRCPRTEALSLMAHASVCLVSSKTEACSMTLVEAMSLNVPTIGGYNSGGVPWVLDYGQAGCLVDVESAEAMAEGIRKVIDDAEYRERLVARARVKVKSEFSPSPVIDAYESIYEAIVASLEKPRLARAT